MREAKTGRTTDKLVPSSGLEPSSVLLADLQSMLAQHFLKRSNPRVVLAECNDPALLLDGLRVHAETLAKQRLDCSGVRMDRFGVPTLIDELHVLRVGSSQD